jgi:hypothetical protein
MAAGRPGASPGWVGERGVSDEHLCAPAGKLEIVAVTLELLAAQPVYEAHVRPGQAVEGKSGMAAADLT